jgi:hypothetical protein
MDYTIRILPDALLILRRSFTGDFTKFKRQLDNFFNIPSNSNLPFYNEKIFEIWPSIEIAGVYERLSPT